MEGRNYSDPNPNATNFCSLDTTAERVGKLMGYCVIIFFSLLGNSLVVAVIMRDKRMRTNTNRFIVNMCISDLFATINVLPTQVMFILSNNEWLIPGAFGEFFCKLVSFVHDVSFAVSIYSMTVIAFDRYLAIVHPYKPHVITSRRCYTIIAMIWVVAIAMHFHYFITMDVFTIPSGGRFCRQVWSEDNAKHIRIHKMYFPTGFVVLYAIPLMAIAFFYTRVVMELYCRSNALEQSREQRRVRNKENREVAVMLISVVVLFAASWAPVNIFFFLRLYKWKFDSSDICKLDSLRFIVIMLSHSNVSQDAFIYFSFNKRFKHGLRKIFESKRNLPAGSSEYINGTSTVGRHLRINSQAILQSVIQGEEKVKLTTPV